MNNTNNYLREKILKTGALPTVSAIAQKILSLDLDSDEGELEFLRVVETDPLISARVIGLANSALYSSGKKICSVRDAIMRLGISKVKSVALGFALLEPLTLRSSGLFSIKKFWFHSFSVAIGMKALNMKLPRESRIADDLVFLAGLMHDIGHLAMAYLAPVEFDQYLSALENKPDTPILKLELDVFGISHTELGNMLGSSWHLPEEVLTVIADHHGRTLPEQHANLVLLVRLSDSIQAGDDYLVKAMPPEITTEELALLGLTQSDLDEVVETLHGQREQIEMISDLLGS